MVGRDCVLEAAENVLFALVTESVPAPTCSLGLGDNQLPVVQINDTLGRYVFTQAVDANGMCVQNQFAAASSVLHVMAMTTHNLYFVSHQAWRLIPAPFLEMQLHLSRDTME
jgi:hypothetical protein